MFLLLSHTGIQTSKKLSSRSGIVSTARSYHSNLIARHKSFRRLEDLTYPSTTNTRHLSITPANRPPTMNQTLAKMHETTFEAECRKAANFPTIEAELTKRVSLSGSGIVDKATSLLGLKNPFSHKANPKDNEVWLWDNTAYRKPTDGSKWEAEFVACYFIQGRTDVTNYISQIADIIGLDGMPGDNEEARKRIDERLQPFVSAVAPARTFDVQIPQPGGTAPIVSQLGPSDGNGISSQIVQLGEQGQDGSSVSCSSAGNEFPETSNTTRYAGPEGFCIISDIDDTIKITQSVDPVGTLRTTFAEEPRVCEGMPDFYKQLEQRLQQPVWFYLSASPYNLYPFLHKFIQTFFLPGEIILRPSSWMFFGGLLQSLTQGVQAYKVSRLEKIHDWLPRRKVICIGDSTQADPESYAEIYKKCPDWVKAIYIRKVVDAPFMDSKNKDSRFEEAFKDVPADIWRVFVNPSDLAQHVGGLGA